MNSEPMSSTSPYSPHPTALAFSEALDDHLYSSNSSFGDSTSPTESKKDKMKKKSLLLGWRNRHSLSSSYPVTIFLPPKNLTDIDDVAKSRQNTANNNDQHSHEKSSLIPFSFTVTQVHDKLSQKNNIEYGTGAFIWPASIVLMKYFEHKCHLHYFFGSRNNSHSFLMKDKTVLDLGAGAGITSIASSLLGASLVVCTDGSKPVVELARTNIDRFQKLIITESDCISHEDKLDSYHLLHQKHLSIHVCEYQWGDDKQTKSILNHFNSHNHSKSSCISTSSLSSYPDIILVSDCVLPKLYPIEPLVQALKKCMGSNTKAYLSYEYRFFEEYDAKMKFLELTNQYGLCVREIPLEEHHEVYQAEDIEIWEVCLA